jgi:hypothetical protein
MKRFFLLLFLPFVGNAQFAPPAGYPGSTAIHKDSSIIISWATGCTVVRGYQNISNPSAGSTTVGTETGACGPADVVNVVSLGDGGVAVLTFALPIKNLNGPDFCVFENSFDPGFLELAFVEVSSDGLNFFRFPAISNVQNTVQIGPFDTNNDASKIHNLAGKYVAAYGVPFDLEELQGTPGLDLENITHVKVVDVVGCIQPQYGTYDTNHHIINDIWPTEFGSGGFDLDAVGVIHQQPVGINESKTDAEKLFVLFPSVTSDSFRLLTSEQEYKIEIRDLQGAMVFQSNRLHEYNISHLGSAIYTVFIDTANGRMYRKIVKI